MTALVTELFFFGTAPPFGDRLHPAAAGPLKDSTMSPNRPGPRKRLQVRSTFDISWEDRSF